MWASHFRSMADGVIPHQKGFYHTTPSSSKSNVVMITPSEAVVQQAKSDLKRTLTDVDVYNPKKKRTLQQFGKGQARKKTKTTKRTKAKTTKRSTSKKKKKVTKSTSKKKKSTKGVKKLSKSKKGVNKKKKSIKKTKKKT